MKKAVTYMLNVETLRALRAWIASQAVPPSQSAVVEAALALFLRQHESSKVAPHVDRN